MPSGPGLPPPDLGRLHFHPLGAAASARHGGLSSPHSHPLPQPHAAPPPLPPQQAPSPPVQGSPPPPASGQRRRNPWLPLGAVASVVAVMIGGLAIWGTSRPSVSGNTAMTTVRPTDTTDDTQAGDPSTSRLSTTSRAADPTGGPDETAARLKSLVPSGAGSCATVSPVGGALATVSCSTNSARYSLFSDSGALNSAFSSAASGISGQSPCASSPSSWGGGQVACGTSGTLARIAWTRSKDLLLGEARGADLDSLHTWWEGNH
jgi:hypothetical protein